MASTCAASATARSALSAARMLMLTWSSWLAEVGNRVDAGRMRQRLELGGERRRGDLRQHQPRLEAAVPGEERRQAAQRRVDQPLGAPLADRRQLGHADRQRVGGERHRRAVEVAARHAPRRRRRRPSGCRWRRWPRSSTMPAGERDGVARRAVHLRDAAHRVGVLDPAAVGVRVVERAAVDQPAQVVGRALLAGDAGGRRGCARRMARSSRAARRWSAPRRCRRRAPAGRRRPRPARARPWTPGCR